MLAVTRGGHKPSAVARAPEPVQVAALQYGSQRPDARRERIAVAIDGAGEKGHERGGFVVG